LEFDAFVVMPNLLKTSNYIMNNPVNWVDDTFFRRG
jgi:hypothetical protein